MLDSAKDMISTIDNSDFFVEHIIVVPDKFSLQTEKLLLSSLSQKAFFNVRVVGLTELASEILGGDNSGIISSEESLLLTQKAIQNVKKDLLIFGKTNINFCYEINKIIMQLKSSLVEGDDLNDGASGLAGIKFHDLKLIYNEYERLRNKNDANARLSMASAKARDNQIFSNTKIYFAFFDAFTAEAYNMLKALIVGAMEVNISLTKAASIGNEYIYEKDIFQKIIKIAAEEHKQYSVIEKNASFFSQKDAIIKGVYSFQKLKCKNSGFYTLLSANSYMDEINAVAKTIYNYTTNGYRYKDFAVMLSDTAKYENYIESIFETFDIPYYIDSTLCADKTILARIIFVLFDVVVSRYSKTSLKTLFSEIAIEKREDLIEKIDLYNVDNKFKYKKYIASENHFDNILQLLEKCKTAREFNDVVKFIIEVTSKNLQLLQQTLEEKKYIKEKNINIQVEEILNEDLKLIGEYEEEISIGEYLQKLKLLLSFKEVSTVPSYVDGVFVGDATTSSLLESKVLFVVGGEKLPVVSTDNGFLSDSELLLNFKDKQIEPTIRMINRRNRFKLFNLLSKAQNKLIISCQLLNEEGKRNELPSYVTSLNEIFDVEPVKIHDQFNFTVVQKNNVGLGNRKSFTDEYGLLLNEKIKEELSIENKSTTTLNKNKLQSNGREVFFGENRARVTQLEQYFSCPFKHFINYGLGLKENEAFEFQVKDVGNFCHRGAELFVKQLLKNRFDLKIDIDEFVDKNFDRILKDENLVEKFEATNEKESLERYIKNHLKGLLCDIVKEMSISKFRPVYLEKKFDSMKVGKDQITLVGKADRIDECGDYFRIIDYKTGTTGNLLKELYFGNKLQLFLYQKVASEQLKKHSAGVFYFSAKFDYSKAGEDDKKLLKGLAENDKEIINLLDDTIDVNCKSQILSISTSAKDGEYKGSAVAKDSLLVYENYAKRVADKATDEICDGFIQPKPDEGACEWCPYAAICMYEKTDGIRKKGEIGDFNSEE